MKDRNQLLLELYRSARETGVEEFYELAMRIVKTAVEFDSARVTTGEFEKEIFKANSSLLYNEPTDIVVDWGAVAGKDLVVKLGLQRLGTAINFHSDTIHAAPEQSAFRDYADRYAHKNGIVVMNFDARSAYHTGWGFYRAKGDQRFDEQERQFMEQFIPHIQEAMSINPKNGS
jgi:hypothetical protein